ncbi:MAG: MFS transporter, partial [Ignavibacteria bacterium]|nr:MFS transporter [Ignavibacteria bacterium]
MKNTRLIIVLLIVFVDMLGFGILIPILPHYSEIHFGATEFEIGVLIASFSFFQFLSNPILGRISDKYGRKPVLSYSLLLASVSYLIFAFAPNLIIALISRSLAGIGGGSLSTAQAYIADITEKHERSKGMGLVGSVFGLGFIFGPIIGGALSVYGYRVPNLAAAGFSFVAFILTLFILTESNKNHRLTSQRISIFNWKEFKDALAHKQIGVLIFLFFTSTFSIANTYGTTPILGYRILKLTDAQIGSIFGIIGIVSIIVQGGLVNYLVRKFSEKKILITGILLAMIGFFAIPFVWNFTSGLFVFSVMSFGMALTTPIILSLISQLTPAT